MPQRIIHYADDTIDRAAMRREDRTWLDERLRAGTTRFVAVASGRHPIIDTDSGLRRPCYLRANDPRRLASGRADPVGPAGGRCILRGRRHRCAAIVPRWNHAAQAPRRHHGSRPHGLRDPRLRERAGLHWHRTHRFCGACGQMHDFGARRPRAPLRRRGLPAGAFPPDRPGGDHPRRRRRSLSARAPAGLGAGPAFDGGGVRRARGDPGAHGGARGVSRRSGCGSARCATAGRSRGRFRNR